LKIEFEDFKLLESAFKTLLKDKKALKSVKAMSIIGEGNFRYTYDKK